MAKLQEREALGAGVVCETDGTDVNARAGPHHDLNKEVARLRRENESLRAERDQAGASSRCKFVPKSSRSCIRHVYERFGEPVRLNHDLIKSLKTSLCLVVPTAGLEPATP